MLSRINQSGGELERAVAVFVVRRDPFDSNSPVLLDTFPMVDCPWFERFNPVTVLWIS